MQYKAGICRSCESIGGNRGTTFDNRERRQTYEDAIDNNAKDECLPHGSNLALGWVDGSDGRAMRRCELDGANKERSGGRREGVRECAFVW